MQQKIEHVMKKYNIYKSKIQIMNDATLQKTLLIIDNAEGISHEDFFEIAELLFLYDDTMMNLINTKNK